MYSPSLWNARLFTGPHAVNLLFALALGVAVQPAASSASEGNRPALLVVKEMLELDLSASDAKTKAKEQETLQVDFAMKKTMWGSHSGHLYYSDRKGHCVKQVDPEGVVTVVAGSGQDGYSGDDGPAVAAAMSSPGPLWGDPAGHLYVLDTGNKAIRKIDERGVISTLLKFPWSAAAMWGDLSGNLFISGGGACRIWKLDIGSKSLTIFAGVGLYASDGDGGPALSAKIAWPNGIWGNKDGDIFLAEMAANRIRKIDRHGIITTIAGTGVRGFTGDGGPATQARLGCPCDVWGDLRGRLFIPDMDNNRIRRVDPDGTIRTIAGTGARGRTGDGGPATNAALYLPNSVWVDRHDKVFISDTLNYRIRLVTKDGIIQTFGKAAAATHAAKASPRSHHLLRLAVSQAQTSAPKSLALVSDAKQHGIFSFASTKKAGAALLKAVVAGGAGRGSDGDGGKATAAKLNHPQGTCTSPTGSHTYVMDTGNSHVRVIDRTTGTIGSFAPKVDWHVPTSCVVADDAIYVTDQGRHAVIRVMLSTLREDVVAGVSGSRGCDDSKLHCPYDIVMHSAASPRSRELLVTDPCCPNSYIRRIALPESTSLPAEAKAVNGGEYDGTPEDRTALAVVSHGAGLWIAGSDDCGLNYMELQNGKTRSVDMYDSNGDPANVRCILDVSTSSDGVQLLGVNGKGKILLLRAETPKLQVSATSSSEGNGFISFDHAMSLNLTTALDVKLTAANGTVVWRHIVDERMSSSHGRGTIDLPDVDPGLYTVEATTRRWPSVLSTPVTLNITARRMPKTNFAAAGNAGEDVDESRGVRQGISGGHLLLAGLGGIAVSAVAIVVLVKCFLKIKHKGYGSMGGTIHYERRGAPTAEKEMAPMTMGSLEDGPALEDAPFNA